MAPVIIIYNGGGCMDKQWEETTVTPSYVVVSAPGDKAERYRRSTPLLSARGRVVAMFYTFAGAVE